jgi:hypothetical protein
MSASEIRGSCREANPSRIPLRSMRATVGPPAIAFSRCQTAQQLSFPRRRRRPGFENFAAPNEGRRSAERRQLCRAGEARRGPRHGPLAFRRSTLAIFGPGTRASPSGIGAEGCSENSSQLGRSTQLSFPRTSRGYGCEPRPQDAKPRSAFRNASRTRPLIERDGVFTTIYPNRSQYFSWSNRSRLRDRPEHAEGSMPITAGKVPGLEYNAFEERSRRCHCGRGRRSGGRRPE